MPISNDPCGAIRYGLRSNSEDHSGVARIDYQQSVSNSIFGRLVEANLDQATTYDGSDPLTLNISAGHWRVSSLVLGDTYLVGPQTVNSFRVGVNRVAAPKIPDNFGTWSDFGVAANSFATKVIGSGWLLTANYVGNNTSHLIVSGELNPAIYIPGTCGNTLCSRIANTNQRRLYYLLNPVQSRFYFRISRLDDGGTGSYNGLLLAAQRRLSRGVSVLVNYTWSHCIGNLWNGYPGLGATSEGLSATVDMAAVTVSLRISVRCSIFRPSRKVQDLKTVPPSGRLGLANLAHYEDQVRPVIHCNLRIR